MWRPAGHGGHLDGVTGVRHSAANRRVPHCAAWSAESASRRSRNLADTAEDAASIQRLQLLASHLVDPLLLDSVEVLHESPHGLLDDLQRFLDLRESPKCIVRDGELAQAFDL
jgi:hypothetical protein